MPTLNINFNLNLGASPPNFSNTPGLTTELQNVYNAIYTLADQIGGGERLAPIVVDTASTSGMVVNTNLSWIVVRYLNADAAFIAFNLLGVSNGTELTFNLPKVARYAVSVPLGITEDNSVILSSPGLAEVVANSNLVSLYPTLDQAAWTGSGDKQASGQFIFLF